MVDNILSYYLKCYQSKQNFFNINFWSTKHLLFFFQVIIYYAQAASEGDVDVIDFLLEEISQDARIKKLKQTNDSGATPLHVACKNCYYDVMKTLIKYEAGLDILTKSILY